MEKSVGDGLRVAPLQDVFRWQDDRLHLKMVGLMKISPLGSLCIKMVLLDSVKFLVFLKFSPIQGSFWYLLSRNRVYHYNALNDITYEQPLTFFYILCHF